MLRTPPDVLITTPESLYLMLTSRAREFLVDAEAVIVDEIHAVARTKRGAHLALTLERLEELAGRPLQRIGLSATQRPLEEVGRFLVGAGRDCTVIDAGMRKPLDLKIHVPVESMREPDAHDVTDPAVGGMGTAGGRRRPGGPGPGHVTRDRDLALDLAGDLPRAAPAGPRAPLHDHLREQPPRRRAARGAAERPGGGGVRAGGSNGGAPAPTSTSPAPTTDRSRARSG